MTKVNEENPNAASQGTGRVHRIPSRGQVKAGRKSALDRSVVPESRLIAGRFGRMFRNLPSYEPSDATIKVCVDQLVEAPESELNNPRIPAGFTYLGQFLDHDLTFDPVSSLERQNDPEGLNNFRTPRLDLDSVYGLGRSDQPYLFSQVDGVKMLLGNGEGPGEVDLPRNSDHIALIGDPRNDENIIVSQLHLAFLKFHNAVVDDIRAAKLNDHLWATGDLQDNSYVFREAQRLVRWHYQWVIIKEFLPLVCGEKTVSELLEETPIEGGVRRSVKSSEFYQPEEIPFIPVEWSVAAYRYGHSQIRPTYNLNVTLTGVNPDIPIFIPDPASNELGHLGGNRQLPRIWSIDWRFFFKQNASGEEPVVPQHSRLIDGKLADGLKHLPGITDGHRFLAERNLLRGRAIGLPSGQAVARRMSVVPLSKAELGLDSEAPLWFYILKEAEKTAGGQHLGPVGGRIVTEVILGILKADPFSFLKTEPTWTPVLPAAISGSAENWGMADLLAYAVPDDGRTVKI